MPLVPDYATVSYNGYTFPVTRKVSITWNIRKDDARRTVIGVDYTIDVDFTVLASAGSDTDGTLEDIRQRLTKTGATLIVEGTGFGDLKVNDGTDVWDMAWGPTPEVGSWESLGANRAARCNWKCRTFVPECSSVSGRSGIIAYNYRNQMSTNADRLTTITTNGYYEIALTRLNANSRVVPQVAGQFKNLLVIPLRPDFTRTREEFNESLDKRRLDFTIVDEARSPNQLPWGCSAASGRHSIVNAKMAPTVGTSDNGQQRILGSESLPWEGKISATYTLHPGFPQVIAWNHFNDFRDSIARGVLEADIGAEGKYVNDRSFIMSNFSVDEGRYQENRTVSFSVNYLMFSSLRNILARGGFSRVEPNTDGGLWIAKWRERGFVEGTDYYQTQFIPGNDVIIDICNPTTILPSSTNGLRRIEPLGSTQTNQLSGVRPETSWLTWECSVVVEENNGTVQQVPLNDPGPASQTRLLRNFGGSTLQQQLTAATGRIENIIQRRRPSRVRIWLIGSATRYFYTIPVPNLISIGNQLPVEGPYQYARQWVARYMLGVPVWACTWKKEYFVEELQKQTITVPRPSGDTMTTGSIKL